MGCAYAKNKMESEYHIHIGKTAGDLRPISRSASSQMSRPAISSSI